VTGASAGIGLATARLLAQKGAKLVLVSRRKDLLEQISKELPNSIAVKADMTKPAGIKNMVKKAMEHFGRIDILINNAGQGYDATVEKTDMTVLRRIFDLDVIGPFVACSKLYPS